MLVSLSDKDHCFPVAQVQQNGETSHFTCRMLYLWKPCLLSFTDTTTDSSQEEEKPQPTPSKTNRQNKT